MKFKARFPNSKIKSKWFKIIDVCISGIEKHASKTRTEQIKIPNNLIIPNLKYCGIITDSYYLNVTPIDFNYNLVLNNSINNTNK